MTVSTSDNPPLLTSLLEHLLQHSDSVTFYEAIELLEVARGVDRIGDATLHDIIRLHDAAHATDGARRILAPYIKAQTARLSTELARATRPLVLADHNKIARAAPGATLLLQLPERRASGFLWHVVQSQGPGVVSRAHDRADAPATAFFLVLLQGAGVIDIELTETFEGRHAPQNNRERVFNIRIYSDDAATDLDP